MEIITNKFFFFFCISQLCQIKSQNSNWLSHWLKMLRKKNCYWCRPKCKNWLMKRLSRTSSGSSTFPVKSVGTFFWNKTTLGISVRPYSSPSSASLIFTMPIPFWWQPSAITLISERNGFVLKIDLWKFQNLAIIILTSMIFKEINELAFLNKLSK